MSAILSSQIEITETSQTESNIKSTLAEVGAMLTMFAVTAVIVLAMSISWVN